MINREDLPDTPDWVPESRDGVRPTPRPTIAEAKRLWDQDWAQWSGDDG